MAREINELKEQFALTFFQVRQVLAIFHTGVNTQMKQYDVNSAELALMKMIKENTADSKKNATSHDIQNCLCISKGAVSKMLGALEQKGYLNREVNLQNRRTLIITLTEAGQKILEKLEGLLNEILIELIQQMGIENAEQFILSMNKFATATKEVLEEKQPGIGDYKCK
ncbi:MarR family winged helix-turn-helix transcriptional regulator [Faecalicatena contorta]|uniref:DNA-binding transcriptional regulator, MarR family n=1 Tax=Faecalicatena contorta TaxID=39482 RepID=A0A316A5M2_9FIRM|nr:transcriptional regulator [Faecalicatena contorta]PWJ52094.1 MarR family transcriptional regulator [Faecalicatena contorta]SUQ12372.1 DNA-binding transcriptional regulator, MarR family [Faecalicatena contorta]